MVGSRCDSVLCISMYLNHRSLTSLEAAAKLSVLPYPALLYLFSTLWDEEFVKLFQQHWLLSVFYV